MVLWFVKSTELSAKGRNTTYNNFVDGFIVMMPFFVWAGSEALGLYPDKKCFYENI